MRLIDADEAVKALGEAPLVSDEYTDEYELGQQKQWEQDIEAIKALPTIEAEPIRRGRWVIEPGIGCKCSACGFDIGNDLDFMEYVNYCPNCGALMEEQKWRNRNESN